MSIDCPKCQTENPEDAKLCKECATPLPDTVGLSQTKTLETPTDKLSPGQTIADRYEIIEELGKGGMGRVYKVQDTQINEDIALKVLKPEISTDATIIERFRNELKIARKITHKNVCRTHDINEVDGTPFITMELVKGESLKNYIQGKGNLSEKEAITIAKQVCEGLSEAHELGIVHRDLKPQNIMIDEKGQIKIMDFGIARSTEIHGMTQSGVMIGTPEYISPEQAEGEEVDNRTDIYALGIVLYEMATGSTPFKGETALSIALKHKTKLPQDPQKLNPKISKALARLILVCMEKEKERRYQTAEELLSDLRNIEEGFPLGTKIRPRSKVSFSILIRNKFFVSTIILALVVMAVGIWLLLPKGDVGPSSLSGKPTLAIVNFRNLTGDSAIDWWKDIFPEVIMDDLRQSRYINVLEGPKIIGVLQELNLLDSDMLSDTDLRTICQKCSASHILTGRFLPTEKNYEVKVTLYKGDTLENLGEEAVGGDPAAEFLSMVNQLTPKIKNLFGLAEALVADDIDLDIGDIRPGSKEAYEYFLKGNLAAYQVDFEQAIDFYKKALDIEPDFGYGYLALAGAYSNLGMVTESKKYAEKAMEYKGRGSAREMNYAIAAINSFSEKTIDKAFEAWQEILLDYPDDSANVSLGFHHYFLENWDEVIKYNGHLWRSGYKKAWFPYAYLSSAYSAKGLYEQAEECLNYYLENIGEEEGLRSDLALVYLCKGEFDRARLEIERASKLQVTPRFNKMLGILSYCRDDFMGAEKYFEEMGKTSNLIWVADTFLNMMNVKIAQGKYKEARTHMKNGLDFYKEERQDEYVPDAYLGLMYVSLREGLFDDALRIFNESVEAVEQAGFLSEIYKKRLIYLKGLVQFQKGEMAEAQKQAADLREFIESGKNPKAIRLFYHLAGLIEERYGNLEAALDYFKDALELIPHEFPMVYTQRLDMAPYLESLGAANFKMGELDKAIEQFEKIQALTMGRLYYGDIYAKSFYTLGKIYEQKGWEGKALESYEQFLKLWKEADPGLPEVDDAKKRLADLKGN